MKALQILGFSLLCVMSVGVACADTVLMFSAEWCKYCQVAKRDMLNNKDEVVNWYVEIVDVDASQDVVKGYSVKTFPTFIYLNDDGQEVDRVSGYKSYRQLKRWVDKNKR